jgi:hypothetical protein
MMKPAPKYRSAAARASGKAEFAGATHGRSTPGAHARKQILETAILETAMTPLCPNCRHAMSTAEISRNAFVCAPCRELVQFFNVGAKEDHTARFRAGVILETHTTGVGA